MTPNELSDIEAEHQALASIGSLAVVRAPASLRHSLEDLVSSASSKRRRRTRALRLAGAGALAATLAATAVLVFGGSPSHTPTVLEASRVALEPARLMSPTENPQQPGVLEASVEGVSFPYWGGQRGWPTAGARADHLDGRAITTVFYTALDGKRIGYAIVAGGPLPAPDTSTVVDRDGVRFYVLDSTRATVVTWREAGHTCILAARGVPAQTLLRLVS